MAKPMGKVSGAVLALVLLAGVTGWLAVVTEHRTAVAAARRTEMPIAPSLSLAESASQLVAQLTEAVDALVIGTASAGEAMTHTIAISRNVRGVLDLLAGLNDPAGAASLTTAGGGLADAEASLLETQGGLGEANTTLNAVQAQLVDVTAAIDGLTAALRADLVSGRDETFDEVSDIDRQYVLWRLALVCAVLTAAGIVILLDRAMNRE